ncbi:MAG: ferritin-like domain-containing protein [Moraxella sp.]|uniref:ferritin-like domain-containing protein n=1 Tax=Moraxella sp. TaxID=479 RepID=UPI0026DD5D49|nr:ferritin-like domain-containing protein [Moraxella sp.]MDO4449725.1 ferritin-like domain-containing protein [Moraxella sp.]
MNPIHTLLNDLLAVYWKALIQHRSHVAVIESEGASLLASEMTAKIADEPQTLENLQNRLLDLGGVINFTLSQPNIGTNLREALQNDYELQKNARTALNELVRQVSELNDATTRNLIEEILADEEEHLAWLEQELNLLEKLGEPLYLSKRM